MATNGRLWKNLQELTEFTDDSEVGVHAGTALQRMSVGNVKKGLFGSEDFSDVAGGSIATFIAGQRNPDLLGKGAYIGRKIEGGGTIFFDYAIGFKGDIEVAPITANLHSYHVDPLTGVVMCDDPEDTTKQDRFYVVSDYDIGDYKHGDNLMWSNGTSGKLYTSLGTATGFGTGKANTQKCMDAATADGLIEWNTNAYNCIWHYISKGDWNRTTERGVNQWFVPSKDELNVLLNMQWSTKSKRLSYDGSVQLIQLPINFYSYYWSSSESSATLAFNANFYDGSMGTYDKGSTLRNHVRLVRTF